MADIGREIGRKIAARMMTLGVTQDELSIRSGVPQSTISKLTRGQSPNPPLTTVWSIADALGDNLYDLADREPPPKRFVLDTNAIMQNGTNAVRAAMDREQAHSTVTSLLANVDFLDLLMPRVVERIVDSEEHVDALLALLRRRLQQEVDALTPLAASPSKAGKPAPLGGDGRARDRKRA